MEPLDKLLQSAKLKLKLKMKKNEILFAVSVSALVTCMLLMAVCLELKYYLPAFACLIPITLLGAISVYIFRKLTVFSSYPPENDSDENYKLWRREREVPAPAPVPEPIKQKKSQDLHCPLPGNLPLAKQIIVGIGNRPCIAEDGSALVSGTWMFHSAGIEPSKYNTTPILVGEFPKVWYAGYTPQELMEIYDQYHNDGYTLTEINSIHCTLANAIPYHL
jgi:hypothetical protein